VQKKLFWLLFIGVSIGLDLAVPLLWATILSLPAVVLCWWVVYRSGWISD
jgi:hypothetical protein